MSITNWPKKDRPREKLIQFGAEALSDTELLAIILGHGYHNKSAVDLARDLLTEYRGLRKLSTIPFQDITHHPGFGPAKYCQVHAAIELSKRFLQESLPRSMTITNSEMAQKFIHAQLRDFDHEVFACLFLDNHHQLIEFEILSHGNLDTAPVNPRHIVKRVLHHNASALIVAHNHPSGIATPSQADIDVTLHLQKSLELFEIKLLDHFVIGDDTVISLADRGLI